MRFFPIASAAACFGIGVVQASVLAERAVVDGPCTGSGGAPGVCVATAKCSAGGGESISDACPGTPNDIQCCTKAACGNGGNCRWKSECTGDTLVGQCPGPADFACCVPKGPGGGEEPPPSSDGNYPPPSLPPVGACKATAVDGARKIIEGNPGATREVFCIRDCACNSENSDHCCGMATDMMCSSAGGVRTESGRAMAEWIVANRDALNLKYVIWGQKIWEVGDAVTDWPNWTSQDDRGSITANHWDHVHVSYK